MATRQTNGKAVKVYYTLPIPFRLSDRKPIVVTKTIGIDGEMADHMPEPTFNIQDYLAEHLKYPKDANKAGIDGRVTVKFTITEEGKIVDPKVFRPVYPSLDSAAVAVVAGMPRWKPGTLRGTPKKVSYMLPIVFKLK